MAPASFRVPPLANAMPRPVTGSLRAEWLFAVVQRLQTVTDVGAASWHHVREQDYGEVACSLPAPASPLEQLLLHGLLLELFRHRLGVSADNILRASLGEFGRFLRPEPCGTEVQAQARQINRFVETHLSARLTLDTLARTLGTSRRRLEAAFKEERGTTVHQFIKQERMCMAIGLLLETDIKTEFIHERVGYRSRSAFYQAFRQTFGRSPARMRKELVSFRTRSSRFRTNRRLTPPRDPRTFSS